MYTGPNTVNDGLVFGYDTGHGVADNNTATRFYPGEPTVNLLNYDTTMPTWPSNSSNMATLTSKTSARSFTVIGTCNVPGAMTFVYPSITTNTAFHTISATFTNNSTETSNVALYIRGKNNDSSTVSQSQTTTIQPGQSIRKTLIGNILTVNGGYTAAVGVWSHGTSGQVNMNVTDIQFEETTHATPFVDGTRSSTQSLIDLTRATNIDVSTLSFDSTGQPIFDGTDDYVDLPSNSDVLTTNGSYTLSAWLKPDGSSWGSNAIPLYNTYNQGTGNFGIWHHFGHDNILRWRHRGASYTYGDLSGIGLVANTWQLTTITWDGTTLKLYKNGVLQNSTTSPSDFARSTGAPRIGAIAIRSSGLFYCWNGSISRHEVYDRALTLEEIKQNFNAYKNKFNI